MRMYLALRKRDLGMCLVNSEKRFYSLMLYKDLSKVVLTAKKDYREPERSEGYMEKMYLLLPVEIFLTEIPNG